MSFEIIFGLGLITFIYAWLYVKTPPENSWFRILYLGLSLFTLVFLTYAMFGESTEQINVYSYDENGTLTGYTTQNVTNSVTQVSEVMETYMGVSLYVPFIVFVIIMIMFIYNIFGNIFNKKNKEY